jgi:TonB family protein
VSNQLFTRRLTTVALAVCMCFGLAACGDDEGDGKTVANTPSGDQLKLPDPPAVVVARDTSKDGKGGGNDVLDWLKMTPEKADKKPPEPPKPAEVKPAEVKPEAKVAPPPVQVAAADRPVLQPVSASAREALALPAASSSAPVQVASATPVQPAAAVPPPAVALKLISREQPGFPIEALRKGVTTGHVTARISVGADGNVKNVEVIKSSPPRVFDSAVVAAAMHWKYAPMAEPASTVTEFDFKGDE